MISGRQGVHAGTPMGFANVLLVRDNCMSVCMYAVNFKLDLFESRQTLNQVRGPRV